DGAAQEIRRIELGLELLARAAGAVAARIAGLGHEALDDAVEFQRVIEAGANQLLDASDMIGREIRAQFDGDAALGRIEIERVFEIGHRGPPLVSVCVSAPPFRRRRRLACERSYRDS